MVSQRLDRVERGGLAGRIKPEEYANSGSNGEGDEDGAAAAASLAVAPDKALRQQRDLFDRSANYEQLRADLTESLGKTVGPPAWVTAERT